MKSLRQGLGRQSQRSPSRSDRKKSSQEAKRSVTGDDRPPVCSCPLRCKTKSAPGGCRRRNTRMQTDARRGGTRAELPFSVQHKQRPKGVPRASPGSVHTKTKSLAHGQSFTSSVNLGYGSTLSQCCQAYCALLCPDRAHFWSV